MFKRLLLVLAGLLIGLVGAYLVASNIGNKKVAAELQQTVAESDMLESLTYGKLSAGLLSPSVYLSDLELQLKGIEDPIAIGELEVNDVVLQDNFPVAADLSMKGLRLLASHSLLTPWQDDLASLGYDGLDLSLKLRYFYDPAQRQFTLEQCEFSEPRMGRLRLDVALHNFNPVPIIAGDWRENPFSALTVFSLISLASLQADYQDSSLAQKLIAHAARQSGISSDQYIDTILADLNQRSGKDPDPRIREALETVNQFMRDPGRISIQAAPQTAMALMRLLLINDMGDVFDQLNLRITS
jgi:hypothetical protein